jgi:hypothetical protein
MRHEPLLLSIRYSLSSCAAAPSQPGKLTFAHPQAMDVQTMDLICGKC